MGKNIILLGITDKEVKAVTRYLGEEEAKIIDRTLETVYTTKAARPLFQEEILRDLEEARSNYISILADAVRVKLNESRKRT